MGKGSLIVAQGGGPTVVINNTLRGVIVQSRREEAIDGIYGAQYGLEGMVGEDLVDLEAESREAVSALEKTPGAALGSSRKRLSDEDFNRVLETLEKYNAQYFLYIGGNGSMAACRKLHEMVLQEGLDVQVIGLPKTVDNDICRTDHCPGYGSACRYYAVSLRELGMDVESLPTPVSVFETMGRNTGWLAAAAGLAKQTQTDAPHLIYVPEAPLIRDRFLDNVRRIYEELGWVVVVVSEGAVDETGQSLSTSEAIANRDDFGRRLHGDVGVRLAHLISDELGLRARSEKPGLCGRASVAHASEIDLEEAFEIGRTGVQRGVEGECGTMIAIKRKEEDEYDYTFNGVDLGEVAGSERSLPEHFLNEDGNMVTQDFRSYASPLLGEPLPQYTMLAERPPATIRE